MPRLDDAKVKYLESAHNKLQMQLNSLSELPQANEDDPRYVLTRHKMNKAQRMLQEHYDEVRPVGDDGKLTADAPSSLPVKNFKGNVGLTENDYFFEPSVEEVRNRIKTDPALTKRLNLEAWTRELEPERRPDEVPDIMSGMSMGQAPQRSRTHLDTLSADYPEYKAVADEMYNERLADADRRGQKLVRYSKVKLGENPLEYLVGGAEKGFQRVVAPVASTVADTLTMGGGRAKYAQNVREAEARQADGDMAVMPPEIDAEEVERRNPLLANIARYGSYALPANLTNLGTNALLKGMGYGTTQSLLGRGAIGAVAGGTANAAESYVTDINRGIEAGVPDSENFRNAASNVPGNYVWGSAYSAPFEVGANIAKGFRQNIREGASNNDLKTLRNARGDTAILGDNFSGYVAPPEIRQDVTTAAAWRHEGTASDVAARRVAPKIQESLDDQLTEARKKIEAQNEEYFNHPAYQQEESSQEAVDAVIDLASRGWVKGQVNNKLENVDPDKLRDIGDALRGVAQPKAFPNRVKAEEYAKKNGGKLIEGHVAAGLFPSGRVNPKNYVVMVASPMNASSLTELERRIDKALNISDARGHKDDPVYERFQRTIRGVRDRFPAYEDDAGNLVAPPGWEPPPGSSQAPPPKPRRSKRPPPESIIPVDETAVADTQPTPTDPGMPPTPKEPSTIGSEDVRALPPTRPPATDPQGGVQGEPGLFEFTPEKIQQQLGVSPQEAQRIANRLNGRDAEAVQLGSDDFSLQDDVMDPEVAYRGLPGAQRQGDVAPADEIPFDLLDRNQLVLGSGRSLDEVRSSSGPSSGTRDVDNLRQVPWDDVKPEDVLAMPPSTAPEFTPKQPSALEWDDVEPLPSSIPSDDVRALPPSTSPQTRRSITPEDEAAALQDENEWYEGIVRPGAPARSAEAQRMSDLIEQQRGAAAETAPKPGVEEAAKRASHWIDAAFAGGDAPSASARAKMVAQSVAHQIGRALTSDELKEVGKFMVPIAGGAALGDALGEDGDSGAALGAMVGGIAGGGSKKPPSGPQPSLIREKGPNKEDLTGFSALRRRQHLQLEKLQKAGAGLGADSEKSVLRKVLGFNQYSATPENKILLEEARKLGLEEELYRAAATASYQRLKEQGTGGAGGTPGELRGGTRNILSRILGPRIDAFAGMLAGEPTHFDGKQGAFEQGSRELLNISGGRAGARFGNDTNLIRDYINQLLFDAPRNEEEKEQRNGTR